ncbi:ATP-binding protein [Hyalangium sp.]|uniref:ATP-binding protein n=1 Tax=Hyalangium sp. TaxID=2028555 RepID=UPI002D5F63B6|nr:ATP-binding protein [Hyalangium sp.]HYI02283.1 ATP-binding protein [Hyalangium sp.]
MDNTVNEPLPPPIEELLRALLAALEASHQGDFSHRLPVSGTHPLLDRLAERFNQGASFNAAFTQEVTRVAKEVGMEGKLGDQVDVQGLSGAWRDLTDAVNTLVHSHTALVRDMTQVASTVSVGDLSHKLTVDVRGEALELKNIVNTMVDRLAEFAAEVNRVAKEVGTEEKLAGKASVLQGMMGVWKDLNDNVNVTEVLAIASRNKSEILANMSHELRTPLNSLLILSEVLAENKGNRLSPKEVEYAKTIHASGTDLLNLINDILDLSKVEAGKMQVEPGDVPLTEVKEFCERTFAHVAEKKGVGFAVSLGMGLPVSIRTDRQRLLQVLKNLLSNAFKFTRSGRVELRVTPVDSQRMRFDNEVLKHVGRLLAFSVVDSGIGIPKEKQQLIFEAFQQADDATSRKYGGTGLGLSISRSLTHLLGGELQLESVPGQGSTFTLYLPERYTPPDGGASEAPERGVSPHEPERIRAPSQKTQAPELNADDRQRRHPLPAESGTSLAGRKVLVVDDGIRDIFALISAMESQKLEVLYAENGKAGLELLHAHPDVDAVLMDMMMPVMDGYETMRAIRQDPRFATLPIIAVTANAMKDDREKCLAAGASDYLAKPVDRDELLGLLRLWCR